MKAYKTLLFDLDGTLFDFNACEKAAFEKAFTAHNFICNDEIYRNYSRINIDLWRQYEQGSIERETIFKTRFKNLFIAENIDFDGTIVEETYETLLSEEHHLIEGVLELTQYLHEKYDLYAVTNGVANTQLKHLENTGLDIYFKGVFVSETLGYQKPMIEFFEYCFERIEGIDLATTLIIGDSLTSDIRGGNNAGIATCWFNPNSIKNNIDVETNYIITDLKDLYKIL